MTFNVRFITQAEAWDAFLRALGEIALSPDGLAILFLVLLAALFLQLARARASQRRDDLRSFITDEARQGKSSKVRCEALRTLASTWPDEEAQVFLIERAKNDESQAVRRAAEQALASTWPNQAREDRPNPKMLRP